jgi:hypothetical protein
MKKMNSYLYSTSFFPPAPKVLNLTERAVWHFISFLSIPLTLMNRYMARKYRKAKVNEVLELVKLRVKNG